MSPRLSTEATLLQLHTLTTRPERDEPGLNRRAFLQRFGAGMVATVIAADIDADRLLWVPGEKTIVLPPVKPLVTGDEAVSAFNRLTKGAPAFKAVTAGGIGIFDAQFNLLTFNGIPVSAARARGLGEQFKYSAQFSKLKE